MASTTEVIEEIEALQAIMMDDVNVIYSQSGQPTVVEVTVKPATAENVEEQHVRVTLIVNIPQGYPDSAPNICLRNPRGIDDDVLELIKDEAVSKCEEYLGLPVIYELIELVREKLTANNTPSCPCAICLFQFTDNDHFTKTRCFHYFHSNCLGRYIMNCEETAAAEEKENQQPLWMTKEKRQLVCPVCRESLNEEMSASLLLGNPPPEEGELMAEFNPTSPQVKALQDKMMSLFLHQKSRGGIIDLEEEKNKFLISAANNLEALETEEEEEEEEFGVENEPSVGDDNQLLPNKEVSKQMKTRKSEPPQGPPPHNRKKGGRGRGNYGQGKRDYTSNGSWWGGSRGRSARKGSRQGGTGNQGVMSESSGRHIRDNNTLGFEDKIQPRNPPSSRPNERQCQIRYANLGKEPTNQSDQYLSPEEEAMKSGRKYTHGKTSSSYHHHHHRGRGSGNSSSRGIPPPGFTELDKNVNPHPAS